jgi:hypothetical protein
MNAARIEFLVVDPAELAVKGAQVIIQQVLRVMLEALEALEARGVHQLPYVKHFRAVMLETAVMLEMAVVEARLVIQAVLVLALPHFLVALLAQQMALLPTLAELPEAVQGRGELFLTLVEVVAARGSATTGILRLDVLLEPVDLRAAVTVAQAHRGLQLAVLAAMLMLPALVAAVVAVLADVAYLVAEVAEEVEVV